MDYHYHKTMLELESENDQFFSEILEMRGIIGLFLNNAVNDEDEIRTAISRIDEVIKRRIDEPKLKEEK